MKRLLNKKWARVLALTLLLVLTLAVPAFAAAEPAANDTAETVETTETAEDSTGMRALATGLAAAGGAIAMGMAASKSVEGIARQPEAEGKIRTTFMLALVFIETAIIYALLAAILIIFVL